ncbi:MAG: cytochrome c3 family protein, partial [Planctomycetia bacterium]
MPSEMRSPKTLNAWIELDYVQRRRAIKTWRLRLSLLLMLLATVGLAGYSVLPSGRFLYQAGPVTVNHQMFNQDCEQCHDASFQTAQRLVDPTKWSTGLPATSDQACNKCHEGAPHHELNPKAPFGDPSCASCHKEHGKMESLVAVTNQFCTKCHADVKAFSAAGENCRFLNVSSFAGDHPEFALFRGPAGTPAGSAVPPPIDPGTVRFNHNVHLAEGGVLTIDPATGGFAK